jgi:ABC-type multidrug transport system permease subunit
VRWLLLKDLQILRRSPLLVALLVLYPVILALLIGFAVSSPPGRPTVAIYTGVSPGRGQSVRLGSQQINVSKYAAELYQSIKPLHEPSAAAAIAAVRSGRALAALIIPADITSQIQNLIQNGTGSPTVTVVLNDRNPVERDLVQQALKSRIADVQQAISRQVLKVAISDLKLVLNGGTMSFLGQKVSLLGLRNARTIVTGAIAALPGNTSLDPALRQVADFAELAIDGLAFANPVLGSITQPLNIDQRQLSGATTPTSSYAVAIAATASLMFVAILLAAAMLALERSENAYRRLVRGLVRPAALLSEKAVLAAALAAALTVVMSAVASAFVPLAWGRFELWVAAAALGGLAFASLGTALGAAAREISNASLLAFAVALPVAFVALVPADAVSGTVGSILDGISFVFPFRASLDALSGAFTPGAGGVGLALLHLLGLALAFGVLARLALRRFAA